jgi:hypothetical protein
MSNVTIQPGPAAASSPGTFTAVAGSLGIVPGTAVAWSQNIEGEVVLCSANVADLGVNSTCCGLVQNSFVNAIGLQILTVRFAGVLTLTTEQWDAVVVGETGGLAMGESFYVSQTLNDAGKLVFGDFIGIGNSAIAPIGVAQSSTTMQLLLQTPVTFTP